MEAEQDRNRRCDLRSDLQASRGARVDQENMQAVVRSLITQIVNRDFEAAVRSCSSSRLSADDLREVIRTYGCKLIDLPEHAYDRLDVIEITDSNPPAWSVHVPLWSEEEGLSDLTLQLTIEKDRNQWNIELDDLLVP